MAFFVSTFCRLRKRKKRATFGKKRLAFMFDICEVGLIEFFSQGRFLFRLGKKFAPSVLTYRIDSPDSRTDEQIRVIFRAVTFSRASRRVGVYLKSFLRV